MINSCAGHNSECELQVLAMRSQHSGIDSGISISLIDGVDRRPVCVQGALPVYVDRGESQRACVCVFVCMCPMMRCPTMPRDGL